MSVEFWGAAIAAPFVGSFLALVADRLPRGLPVVLDRSRCRCGRVLGARELVPILSWLVQRGRCRQCGIGIGWHSLAAEIAAPLLVIWAGLVVPPSLLIASAGLGWLLLLLAAIDLATLRLPDRLTLPLALGGLAVHAGLGRSLPVDQLLGALIGFLAFAGIARAYRLLRGRDGLGGGDAKLLAAGGAWVGWQGLPTVVLISALVGIAMGIGTGRVREGRWNGALAVPFGPGLAAAIWLVWLYGPLQLG